MSVLNITRKDLKAAINDAPAVVMMLAKVRSKISPIDLYTAIKRENQYSYLLESVEKEKRHARFSFVGSDPDAVMTVKDRIVSVDIFENSGLADHIHENLKNICDIGRSGSRITGSILDGHDSFDAVRCAFPERDVKIINKKDFNRQIFLGGAIGYHAYDTVYDSWLDIRSKGSDIPDARFAITTKTAVFDHMTGDLYVVLTPFVSPGDDADEIYEKAEATASGMIYIINSIEPQDSGHADAANRAPHDSISCDTGKPQFEDAVRTAKKHIFDGDIFQVVLSRRYEIDTRQEPLDMYLSLRRVNPSPYMYLFEFGDLSIIGASPETLVTVHDRRVVTNPIAGTCPRGKTPDEDALLAKEMLNDKKERAEHVMLVDLGRNDVRMVAKGGTVRVDDFMSVLKYSHVQHIESTVSGTLRDECDAFDAVRAIFPAGTLSGAPKIRAMEIIHDLEKSPRGIYGGGVGYYSWDGDADFAIVIRTIIKKGRTAYIQAGAGIVADSDPAYEYNETERKMAAMIKAIGIRKPE